MKIKDFVEILKYFHQTFFSEIVIQQTYLSTANLCGLTAVVFEECVGIGTLAKPFSIVRISLQGLI